MTTAVLEADPADPRLEVPASLFNPRHDEEIGQQIPRYFHAPQWESTAGEDLADIASIAGLEFMPWQQIVANNAMAEDPVTGRWQAFRVCLIVPRQNGKNALVRARLLAGLFLFGEEKLVFSAHLFKTAHAEYLAIRQIIESIPEWMDMVARMPDSRETAIILKDGRRLDFLSRVRTSGRGLQGDLVIIDEAFAVSEELISDLLPVMVTRENAQVWFTSSTGFDYSTVLKNLREDATERPEENKHLAFFEWSVDIKKIDWRSREAVQKSNPSLGYLISWDWVREVELSIMGEEQYQRERLGVWADNSADAVIGVDLWDRAVVSKEIFQNYRVKKRSLALEITQDRSKAFVAGAALLNDGRVVVEIIDALNGVAKVQDLLHALVKKSKPVAGIVIDSYSGASAMVPRLSAAGIPVSLATTRDLTAGSADFYDRLVNLDENLVFEPTLLHGSHPMLDDAAYTARRRPVGASRTAWTWQAFGGIPVEPLRAVTLALRGLSMEPIKKRRGRVG